MSDDLFTNLKKYRPRDGHTPTENFLTEVLVWILNNNEVFAEFYLQKILSKLDISIEIKEKFYWKSQVNFNGYYPDVVLELEQVVIIFEHKVWAKLHPNQLDNYRDYAKDNYNNYYIILITGTVSHHEQNPDLSFCWSQIYGWIESWQKENEENFFLKNLLTLLKTDGLAPNSAISHNSILYYNETRHFETNIRMCLLKVCERINSSINSNFDFLSLKNQNAWNRIGFGNNVNQDKSWMPAIFCGVILDSKQHGNYPSVGKGVDFVLMLSFSQNLHDRYLKNPLYKNLVVKIRELVREINSGWEFNYHLKDKLDLNINKWHPIQVRKSVIEILRGTTNPYEQEDRFLKECQIIIPKIIQLEEFIKLKIEWKN